MQVLRSYDTIPFTRRSRDFVTVVVLQSLEVSLVLKLLLELERSEICYPHVNFDV